MGCKPELMWKWSVLNSPSWLPKATFVAWSKPITTQSPTHWHLFHRNYTQNRICKKKKLRKRGGDYICILVQKKYNENKTCRSSDGGFPSGCKGSLMCLGIPSHGETGIPGHPPGGFSRSCSPWAWATLAVGPTPWPAIDRWCVVYWWPLTSDPHQLTLPGGKEKRGKVRGQSGMYQELSRTDGRMQSLQHVIHGKVASTYSAAISRVQAIKLKKVALHFEGPSKSITTLVIISFRANRVVIRTLVNMPIKFTKCWSQFAVSGNLIHLFSSHPLISMTLGYTDF